MEKVDSLLYNNIKLKNLYKNSIVRNHFLRKYNLNSIYINKNTLF